MAQSPLDDPHYARFAWARYWRLMRGMTWLTIAVVAIALSFMWWRNGDFASIHLYIATAAGVSMAMLLTAALMGLVFLSNGSGHDAAIDDLLEKEREGDG
jgi:hypothetical protein